MWLGSPPPEKLYRQPARATTLTTPNRRIERCSCIGGRDSERERPQGSFVAVPDLGAIPGHPLDPPPVDDSLDASQLVADESYPPCRVAPNVCPQCVSVNLRDGVWQRRYG